MIECEIGENMIAETLFTNPVRIIYICCTLEPGISKAQKRF